MNKSVEAECLISIQPYFVLDSKDFKQRIIVKNGISHFFAFENHTGEDFNIKLLVDGCSNLIFEYKDGTVRTHLIGSTVETRTFSIKKDADYFGVRLMPTGVSFIKELPVKNTIGEVIILEELESTKDLCLKMKDASTFESRIDIFTEEYLKLRNEVKSQDKQAELFDQITELIIQRKGKVRVSELETLSGYSSRYINKIFEKELGLSAKQLCNSVKFQFILSEINKGGKRNLTSISSDYNFYDQAHFIHEFKEFTGVTPSEYANLIEFNHYKDCVTAI